MLRQAHRPVRLQPQPVGCVLLQGAGLVGRRRVPGAVLRLDREHFVAGALELPDDLSHLALLRQLELVLAALLAQQPGGEDPLRKIELREHRVERPGFDRDELLDLLFTLAHQSHRDRLHPAGTQAFADLLPEQWTELVADQSIDHPSRLLGVDQVLVHWSQRVERLLDRAGRDLVQFDAPGILQMQHVRQMPGDRFAFAVRVRCQQDVRRAFGGGLQFLDRRFLSRNGDVLGLERVLDVDPQRALRQVTHMPHRGTDVVLAAEETAKRLCLCWRFNDDQWICHFSFSRERGA